MSDSIEGKVQAISDKSDEEPPRHGIRVGDKWYNDFGSPPEDISKGDYVEIEYEQNGDYQNVINVEKTSPPEDESSSSSPQGSVPKGGSQGAINRQSAVKSVSQAMGRIYEGEGELSPSQVQLWKGLVEEMDGFIENGEFDVPPSDKVLQALQDMNAEDVEVPDSDDEEESSEEEE